MASLAVDGDRVVVRLTTAERVLALVMSDPEAPMSAVRSARVVRPAKDAIRGIRAPGTGFPGVLWLGHWRGRGFHDFVAVYGQHEGVVVELEGLSYSRFVVSTDHAESVAREIKKHLPASRS